MNVHAVFQVLDTLEKAGVKVWLDGGWGVDALLEEQTREHGDLDVIVSSRDIALLIESAQSDGFRPKPGGTATNFVLAHPDLGELDVHAIEFDDRGYGVFALSDGRRWPFPPSAFAGRGRISSRFFHCLSAEAQVQCHGQGYRPTDTDLADMERLQERFGVVLPLILCRQCQSR